MPRVVNRANRDGNEQTGSVVFSPIPYFEYYITVYSGNQRKSSSFDFATMMLSSVSQSRRCDVQHCYWLSC